MLPLLRILLKSFAYRVIADSDKSKAELSRRQRPESQPEAEPDICIRLRQPSCRYYGKVISNIGNQQSAETESYREATSDSRVTMK